MQSHEVFKQLLKKVSAKQISSDLHLSLSLVYKWAEPPEEGSGAVNPLDRVEQIVRITKDSTPVQWLCERAGGFFIRNPEPRPHPYHLIPATNNIVQEFADMFGVITNATGDGHISPEEARAIRARWEELKSVTEGFVRTAEEGKFPKPPDPIPNLKAAAALPPKP